MYDRKKKLAWCVHLTLLTHGTNLVSIQTTSKTHGLDQYIGKDVFGSHQNIPLFTQQNKIGLEGLTIT